MGCPQPVNGQKGSRRSTTHVEGGGNRRLTPTPSPLAARRRPSFTVLVRPLDSAPSKLCTGHILLCIKHSQPFRPESHNTTTALAYPSMLARLAPAARPAVRAALRPSIASRGVATLEKVAYTATADASGLGRNGRVVVPEAGFDFKLA